MTCADHVVLRQPKELQRFDEQLSRTQNHRLRFREDVRVRVEEIRWLMQFIPYTEDSHTKHISIMKHSPDRTFEIFYLSAIRRWNLRRSSLWGSFTLLRCSRFRRFSLRYPSLCLCSAIAESYVARRSGISCVLRSFVSRYRLASLLLGIGSLVWCRLVYSKLLPWSLAWTGCHMSPVRSTAQGICS